MARLVRAPFVLRTFTPREGATRPLCRPVHPLRSLRSASPYAARRGRSCVAPPSSFCHVVAVVTLRGTFPPRSGGNPDFSDVSCVRSGGAEGIRTPDLINAIDALSQLSYSPTVLGWRSDRVPSGWTFRRVNGRRSPESHGSTWSQRRVSVNSNVRSATFRVRLTAQLRPGLWAARLVRASFVLRTFPTRSGGNPVASLPRAYPCVRFAGTPFNSPSGRGRGKWLSERGASVASGVCTGKGGGPRASRRPTTPNPARIPLRSLRWHPL